MTQVVIGERTLTTEKVYQNDTLNWRLGLVTKEVLREGSTVLKEQSYSYEAGKVIQLADRLFPGNVIRSVQYEYNAVGQPAWSAWSMASLLVSAMTMIL